MPTPRRKIHTYIKFLVATNALPKVYLNQISKAQQSSYKNNFKNENYFGHDLNDNLATQIDLLKLLNEVATLKTQIIALLQIIAFLKMFFVNAKTTLAQLYNPFFIQQFCTKILPHITLKKAAQYVNINTKTISNAIKKHTAYCANTTTKICRKIAYHQLTPNEVKTLENFTQKDEHKYWPLTSIYYQGLRQNIFHFSKATFYNYCKYLGITRTRKKNNRNQKGIVATYVNQYWHADVTIYRTLDGIKQYIYLVVDRYSKKILSHHVSTTLSGTIRTQTFAQAVAAALAAFNVLPPIQLVVDAGTENLNNEVDNWTDTVKNFLKKVIHLTEDFTGNNSAIEAVNAIVKNRYINHMKIENHDQLKIIIDKVVNDYNNLRPHTSHKGLTPNEVYNGIKDLPTYDDFSIHRTKRREENKLNCCKLVIPTT